MGFLRIFKKFRFIFIVGFYGILIIFSYYLSFLLRFDFSISAYSTFILKTLLILIFIKICVFYYFGLFHSSLRHVSIFDLWQVIKANSIASVGFFLSNCFYLPNDRISTLDIYFRLGNMFIINWRF